MEIVMTDGPSKGDLAAIAFADNREEAEMIQGLLKSGGIPSLLRSSVPNGPLLGFGLLPRSSQRIMVNADQAGAARRLLNETLSEGGSDAAAQLLEEGTGKRPRNYSLLGAYARAWLWSVGVVALAFGVFLLHRLA